MTGQVTLHTQGSKKFESKEWTICFPRNAHRLMVNPRTRTCSPLECKHARAAVIPGPGAMASGGNRSVNKTWPQHTPWCRHRAGGRPRQNAQVCPSAHCHQPPFSVFPVRPLTQKVPVRRGRQARAPTGPLLTCHLFSLLGPPPAYQLTGNTGLLSSQHPPREIRRFGSINICSTNKLP